MLAGKFKSPEDLEKAYLELQSKLGANDGEEQGQQEALQVDEDPTQVILTQASDEFSSNGELSQETVAKLSELSNSDLINAYLEAKNSTPAAADLNQQQVNEIFQAAGGEQNYNALIEWASQSLPEAAVNAYNSTVETGDPYAIQLALAGLKAAYTEQNGFEGEMLTGKPAFEKPDVFRSQAEVLAAMQDPRYDRDPAYRNDVFEKIGRSPIQY
tara:strand:- start:417 stop:1058 length:642 start_codon:yes stop_codon:yes gene_type:complete